MKRVSFLSNKEFISDDGRYRANNDFISDYENIFTNEIVTANYYQSLMEEYSFMGLDKTSNYAEKNKLKEAIKSKRQEYISQIGEEVVYAEIYKHEQQNSPTFINLDTICKNKLDRLINYNTDFISFFFRKNDYLVYYDTIKDEENKVLIGHDIWFLNYISFSFDNKFMAFAIKRKNASGEFGLYDLVNKKTCKLIEDIDKIQLMAVWTAVFNKHGEIAFYDSKADCFIYDVNTNKIVSKGYGRNFLCFSPTGNYVALSNQGYLSYEYHPFNWGHQPSTNVYICKTSDLNTNIKHFKDLGVNIKGTFSGRGNVASVAFSSDEKRLMMVGENGVVVVRNIHLKE